MDYELLCTGVSNCLRHLGVLRDGVPIVTRESLGLSPTTIVLHSQPDLPRYISVPPCAPTLGLFEASVEPGQPVDRGQQLGLVHSLDKPSTPPTKIIAPAALTVMGVRTIVSTTPGDALFWAGREITVADLLDNNF
eukprot:SAG31_NODE_7706_length_1612_cov_2.068738_2_plen_136_part_00